MKKIIATTLTTALLGLAAHAQGTVNFANVGSAGGASLNAPDFLNDGVTKLGANFSASLLVGTSANSLTAVATHAYSNGYVVGGTTVLAGMPAGTPVWVAIEAWDTTLGGTTTGASFAAAVAYGAAGHGNVWGYSGAVGFNASATPFQVTPADPSASPPGTPSLLVGLNSFSLNPVPEPTTFALAGLGAAAALIFRRRK
jgi:hypothetical protein